MAAPSDDSGISSPLGLPTSTSSISISRSLGRRTLRTTSSDNPLLPTSDTLLGPSTSPTGGQYAVYSSAKKRSSILGGTFDAPTSAAEPATSAATPAPAPPSPSAPPTPPFAPSIQSSVPPLISRPSNSTLPTTSGRPYARSVSEAKELLQGQAFKAEVQSLGLGNDSTGAAMVQKLASVGKEAEWTGVMKALASGKVTLLLPAEKLMPTMQLTPAFFLDHLVIFEPSPSASPEGFATLSGFKGCHGPDELVFASYVETAATMKRITAADYTDLETLKSFLGPAPPAIPSDTASPFPSSILISQPSHLSIPRATARSVSGSSTPSSSTLGRATAGSRLAALFAKPAAAAPAEADLPPVVPAPVGLLSGKVDSDDSSWASSASPTPSRPSLAPPNLDIPVLAVGKVVRHNDLLKAVGKALDGQLRESLKKIEGGDDSALQDRVCAFAARFQPPSTWGNVEDMSHAYQDLSEAARSDLNRCLRAQLVKEKRRDREGDATGAEATLAQQDYVALEGKVDASLEKVERVLLTALYDRMITAPTSTDAQEDENLASRIAALNMLELSLEHLGLDLSRAEGSQEWGEQSRTIGDTLEDIVGVVGKELALLDDSAARTPKSKLDIFVNLHKIIVEHLSDLPPIPLKKEVSGAAQSNEQPTEVEMDDASIRTGNSRTSSRPASPPPAGDEEDALLRTPRPPVEGEASSSVPEIHLPSSELTSSVHEATSSSLFDTVASPKPSPPTSVFDSSASSRRGSTTSSAAPTSSSADLILPLLIYAVVRFNPRLPSHLNYATRFRAESLLRGESSYCSTNMHAVIEFLNTVDISSLGLNSAKVLAYTNSTTTPLSTSIGGGRSRPASLSIIGGRRSSSRAPSQDLDQFVDSANHALVRAADLLFGPKGFAPKTIEDVKNVLDGAAGSVATRARGTLLRRATNASAVGVAVDGGAAPKEGGGEDEGKQREMVDFVPGSGDAFDQGTTVDYSAQREQLPEKEKDDDARSVRSISSLLGKSLAEKRTEAGGGVAGAGDDLQRPTLGDRLASIPGLGRFSSESKTTTVSGAASPQKPSIFSAFSPSSSPSSRRSTISHLAGPPLFPAPISTSTDVQPVQRYLECQPEDLRLGEVGDLLREYRKLAEVLGKAREAAAAAPAADSGKTADEGSSSVVE